MKDQTEEFNDVLLLDDCKIKDLLKEIDSPLLAKALIGTGSEVQEKFFHNLRSLDVAMLKEDMEFLGSVPLEEVLLARKKVLEILRTLN